MRFLGWLLLGAILLSVLRVGLAVLVVGLALAWTILLLRDPAKAVGIVLFLIVLSLLLKHPLPMLILLTVSQLMNLK